MTECSEFISVMDIELTKKTIVMSIPSISCHSIHVRDYHILQTVLLGIKLLLIIIILCFHYVKQKGII